jgi:hypothetical protein
MPLGKLQATEFGRITEKQARFLNAFAATGFDPNQKRACASLAGYKGQKPEIMPLHSETVRKLLQRELEAAELTIGFVVKKHKEAFEATKESPKGNTVADNRVRLRAVELGYEVWDAMPSKRVAVDSRSVQFNFDMETLKRAEEVTGEVVVDSEAEEEAALERPF